MRSVDSTQGTLFQMLLPSEHQNRKQNLQSACAIYQQALRKILNHRGNVRLDVNRQKDIAGDAVARLYSVAGFFE